MIGKSVRKLGSMVGISLTNRGFASNQTGIVLWTSTASGSRRPGSIPGNIPRQSG